jgi:NADPH:quinone reductase-like Zn-dependent oxidoreductase
MDGVTTGDTMKTTKTMRAVTQERYGMPEALRVDRIPVPEPGPGEVLVRVRAAGVDAGTWHLTTGRPYIMRAIGFGWRGPKASVRGLAFAGIVETSGPDSPWQAGDRVFGSADGALAEFVVAKAADLVRMPEGAAFEAAATLPVSGVTALQAVTAARAGAGDRVLVIGAAGGVGHLAVQLAVARGARVTGLCSGAKADLVRGLGAERVVDYTTTDVLADGIRYDAIVDTAGNRPLSALRRILAPEGAAVLVGGEAGGAIAGGIQRTVAAGLLDRFTRQRLVGLIAKERKEDLEELARLLSDGTVRPVLDTVFPLEETAAAVEHIGAGRARGKVVVTP